MAIRFQCPACSEPIEVDDEWASRVVRCPYCQRTVAAAAQSTLPSADQIPVATLSAAPDRLTYAGTAPPAPPPAPAIARVEPTNRVALAALILALTSVGLLVVESIILGQNALEMKEFERHLEEAASAGRPSFTGMMNYVQAQGGSFPGWMIALSIMSLISLGAWVASIICAVVALFRPGRRGMAVAALILAGLLCGVFCLSAVGSMMA